MPCGSRCIAGFRHVEQDRAFSLLLLTRLVGSAQTQAAPSPYQISVNVDLVVLHAPVRESRGGFSSDLREPDFQVYEDGVLQSILLFRHECQARFGGP